MGKNHRIRNEEPMKELRIQLTTIRALLREWEQATNESESEAAWIAFKTELQNLWEATGNRKQNHKHPPERS